MLISTWIKRACVLFQHREKRAVKVLWPAICLNLHREEEQNAPVPYCVWAEGKSPVLHARRPKEDKVLPVETIGICLNKCEFKLNREKLMPLMKLNTLTHWMKLIIFNAITAINEINAFNAINETWEMKCNSL